MLPQLSRAGMNAAASGKPVKSLFGSLPSTERHSTGGDSSPAKRAGPAGGSPAKAAYKSPSPASRPSVAAARQLGLGTFGSPSKHDNRYPLRPASARASPVTTHLPFQDSAGAFAAHQAHALQEENRRFRAELYVLRGKADALTVRDPPAFCSAALTPRTPLSSCWRLDTRGYHHLLQLCP